MGTITSRVLDSVVDFAETRLRYALQSVIGRHFELKAMRSMFLAKLDLSWVNEPIVLMSLDVPTFSEPGIQSQLGALRNSAAWGSLPSLISTASKLTSIATQGAVLGYIVLRQQISSMSLANVVLSIIPVATSFLQVWRGFLPSSSESASMLHNVSLIFLLSAWAATCRDENYIRMQGLAKLSNDPIARQELVAGDLQPHVLSGGCHFQPIF